MGEFLVKMIVICDINMCPYRSNSGFCRRRVINLKQGVCQFISKGIKEEPLYFDNVDYRPKESEVKRIEAGEV